MRGQSSSSVVPSMIKTNMLLNDDLAHKERFFTAKITNWKVIKTRHIEQILY